MPTYRIGQCVQRRDETYLSLETVFPDGAVLRAIPDFTRDGPRAEALGVSVLDLWRTHDLAHCVACEAMRLPWSPTLWRLSHHLPLEPQATGYEEDIALALQAYVLTGVETGELRVFEWRGVKRQDVRQRVLAYLAREEGNPS